VALVVALLLAFFVLPTPWNVVAIVLGLGIEAVELTWGLRLARRRARVGADTLIGREAVVVTPFSPVGQVFLDGERWQARGAPGAQPGERVVVRARDGLTLIVDRQ
jgi:membrane-bound serine protease (ClpP class)